MQLTGTRDAPSPPLLFYHPEVPRPLPAPPLYRCFCAEGDARVSGRYQPHARDPFWRHRAGESLTLVPEKYGVRSHSAGYTSLIGQVGFDPFKRLSWGFSLASNVVTCGFFKKNYCAFLFTVHDIVRIVVAGS